MLLQAEHLQLAAENLDEAVASLRPHGEAGINYEVGSLAERLPEIRKWLTSLTEDADWARCFYNSYVEFALALAAALPAVPTDKTGVTRGEDGWQVPSGHPVIWFGDAHFDDDLEIDGPLIVLGDLSVDGLLSDGDVDRSFLVVTGNLRTRALYSGAFNLVLGDIHADVVVCFNNDGGLGAGGDLVADLFVQEQHSYEMGGEMRVRVPVLEWLPNGEILEHDLTTDERIAAWLPTDYVAPDGEVDTWRILTEAAAGRSPVLASPRE
jgi:hypothetical protein